MPIYEYQCEDCENLFSKMRPFSQADALIACTGCQSTNTHRRLSRIAAVHSSGAGHTSSSGGSCAGCSSSNCGSCRH